MARSGALIENILSFPDSRAVVLGLGISNLPLCRMLARRTPALGARLCIRDGKDAAALGSRLDEFIAAGADIRVGCDPVSGLCDRADLSHTVIFRSPGIRPDAGELEEAVRRGALLTSEMEWFCDCTPARIVAVTGSDGKTTTTTVTHLLLDAAGEGRVWVGGNIGTPLLDKMSEMTAGDTAVLELSSFQLQTMAGPAKRAAITNISPNHLNWHRDMEEYTGAKYHVFGPGTELLVLNAKNPLSRAAADRFGGHVTFFTAHNGPEEGFAELTGGRPDSSAVFLRGDEVIYAYAGGQTEEVLLRRSEIRLPGIHNTENYMTAAALTRGLVPTEILRRVAAEFGGVEHRFEYVRTLDGVKYYNSSIDSSPSRTVAALSNLNCRPVVICGGRDKHVPFDPMAEALYDRASAVVLTGEAAPQILDALRRVAASRPDGGASLRILSADDFRQAVYTARGAAVPGSAVLLSPGCTSFDRFANFEERGNTFKEIVRSLE